MQVAVTYDREADAAYISFVRIEPGQARSQKATALGWRGDIVLDFDADGLLLGAKSSERQGC